MYIIRGYFLAVFLFPFLSLAQIDYRDGYVVLTEGDTLNGLIATRTRTARTKYCLFKQCRVDDLVKLSTSSIKGYGFVLGPSYGQQFGVDKFELLNPPRTRIALYARAGLVRKDFIMQGNRQHPNNAYRIEHELYGPSFALGLSTYSFFEKLEFLMEISFIMSRLEKENKYIASNNQFFIQRNDFVSLPSVSIPLGFKYNFGNPRSTPTFGIGMILVKFIDPAIYTDISLSHSASLVDEIHYGFDVEQLPSRGMWFSIGYFSKSKEGRRFFIDMRFEELVETGQVESMRNYNLLVGRFF
ncbi:MAG: hypothetical protein ABJH04_11750 [Cyclobacteriaceae bacterium]